MFKFNFKLNFRILYVISKFTLLLLNKSGLRVRKKSLDGNAIMLTFMHEFEKR